MVNVVVASRSVASVGGAIAPCPASAYASVLEVANLVMRYHRVSLILCEHTTSHLMVQMVRIQRRKRSAESDKAVVSIGIDLNQCVC
jgi:hypothetical protein